MQDNIFEFINFPKQEDYSQPSMESTNLFSQDNTDSQTITSDDFANIFDREFSHVSTIHEVLSEDLNETSSLTGKSSEFNSMDRQLHINKQSGISISIDQAKLNRIMRKSKLIAKRNQAKNRV